MKIHHLLLNAAAAATAACIFFSCNPASKVPEGEYLLTRNTVIDKYAKVDKSELESYLKQKPNRKVLLWKMYLHIYNGINQEKLARQKERCNVKVETKLAKRTEKVKRKNEKRLSKGKEAEQMPDRKNIFSACKLRTGFKQWWLSIGEPPVIYDSALAKKTASQMKLFLNNKGYFNSTVKDSVGVHRKKATTYYTVYEGTPYTLRNISYQIKDGQLEYYVLANASASLLSRGMIFDADVLQQERDRITDVLRNDGYFYFAREYIYFEADSTHGTHEIDITLGIKNPFHKVEGEKSALGGDSISEGTHERYYMNNIFLHTDYDQKLKLPPSDSLLAAGEYYLLYNRPLRYKPKMLVNTMFISKGELFQQKHADQTYRRLSELKLFRSVQIAFLSAGGDKLDCHIYLTPIPKQSIAAIAEGTNTSETRGIAGNLVYDDKNSFKGGEIFEMKLKGALEVQKSTTSDQNLIIAGAQNILPFNTLELGSEASLRVPRFLTPFPNLGTQSNNAKTNFTGLYNFQQRPNYARSVSTAAFGYSWKETAAKQHLINPVEFSLVNVYRLSDKLDSTIKKSKDLFLKNSYSNHLTFATRYAFVYNNQEITRRKNYSYFRFGAEGAGNFMRGIFKLIDSRHPLAYDRDTIFYSDGSYSIERSFTIDKIRFSQYVRTDIDYRHYKLIDDKDKVVYRFAFGIGKPLYNLRTLPLEKSFFAGGPNSVRAWQARTLGPGADTSGNTIADKIGDVKMEANLEYRFNVLKALNAAMFADAGNVWLRKPYSSYPGGEITHENGKLIPVDSLLQEIAIGAGLGIRFDFNFFIIRLDGAFKIKDPSLLRQDEYPFNSDSWVGKHLLEPRASRWKSEYAAKFGHRYPFFVLNFGIGYPF